VDDSREELEAYREKVVLEIRRREVHAHEVGAKVREAERLVKEASRSRSIAGKSPGRGQIEEAHRTRLKESLQRLTKDLGEAEAELRRAEERLVQVDRKIAEVVSREG